MKATVGESPRTKNSEEAQSWFTEEAQKYGETGFWFTFVVQLAAQMMERQFSDSYSYCSPC